MDRKHTSGFTLIELSIVLVIIGLIVGGILVGRDLIEAAEVRAQISQIEKYSTAVNTFRVKYGYLPGDIPDPAASSLGLQARGQHPGEGDGDGIINSWLGGIGLNGTGQSGEPLMVWVDLSTAQMIDGSFDTATPQISPSMGSLSSISDYWPAAKIGDGNIVAVWSGGWSSTDGNNYFVIMNPPYAYIYANAGSIYFGWPGNKGYSGLTVLQAYNIDTKIDDGLPQSGRVIAIYPMAQTIGWSGPYAGGSPWTTATQGSSGSCFDNSTSSDGQTAPGGNPQHYSMEIQGGANPNCPLSFRFQ